MAEVNLVEAVNLALAHEMARDPNVVLLGEDIGVNGGVFRATVGLQARFGAGIHAPEHHSESLEAIFSHIPGLRMVIPSSPARAYGLLLAAIRDPDPVIFFEPTRIYRLFKQEVADDGEALPLDACFVLREGRDLTIVSWGAMLQETLGVADLLAAVRKAMEFA